MRNIMLIAIVAVLGIANAGAQTTKVSDWTEVQVVDIPFGQTVYKGVTKSGNPKAWFEFGELSVTVSPNNAEKYSKQEVELVLVKWQHKETGKFRYSTRQKYGRKAKVTPNVDLSKLF